MLKSNDSINAIAFGVRLARKRSPLVLWVLRAHHRKALRRLLRSDPHLLKDIGLTRGLAAREAAKPFWRA